MKIGTLSRINNTRNSVAEFNFINRISEELSGELHDNVSSRLSILRLKLFQSPNEVEEAIQLLDTVITSVREISHGLYSPTIEHLNFIDAVRDFLSPLHNLINIETHNLHNQTCNLPTHTKLFLFRIFQEVINNTLKHSNATKVSIYIRSSKSFFYFLIKDNGDGFLDNVVKKEGIGLKNIKYRAYKLQAKYKFKTQINKGSLFIISVPIL